MAIQSDYQARETEKDVTIIEFRASKGDKGEKNDEKMTDSEKNKQEVSEKKGKIIIRRREGEGERDGMRLCICVQTAVCRFLCLNAAGNSMDWGPSLCSPGTAG